MAFAEEAEFGLGAPRREGDARHTAQQHVPMQRMYFFGGFGCRFFCSSDNHTPTHTITHRDTKLYKNSS